MITEALLTFMAEAVGAVLGLVPQWEPPTEALAASSSSLGASAARANGYFPVVTLGACLVLVLGFKVFLIVWRLVVFIYHQIWGSD